MSVLSDAYPVLLLLCSSACAGSSIADTYGSGSLPGTGGSTTNDTEVEVADEDDGVGDSGTTTWGGGSSGTPPGTTGGGPSSTGGGSSGGGSGGLACADPLVPVGGACPPQCENGCAGNVCQINCDQDSECEAGVVCPANFDCAVVCSGEDACAFTTVTCPTGGNCSVDCLSDGGCEGSTISCGNGLCDVHCVDEADTCQDTTVTCGAKACTATCEAGADEPAVACGAACACTPC